MTEQKTLPNNEQDLIANIARTFGVPKHSKEMVFARTAIQAYADWAVEKALLSTGTYVRCDNCNQMKHVAGCRHTYGDDGKPNGHVCDTCVAQLAHKG